MFAKIPANVLLLSAFLLHGQPLVAVSIFQWVDANGVTHFSDEEPVDGVRVKELSSYELEENFPAARDPQGDHYSISNQWKRANEEREASMKLKLEQQKLDASRASQQAPVLVYDSEPEPRYYPVYSPAYGYYPGANRLRNPAHTRYHTRFPQHFGSQRPGPSMPEPRASVTPGFVGNVGGSAAGTGSMGGAHGE